jgi:hypothetical protein
VNSENYTAATKIIHFILYFLYHYWCWYFKSECWSERLLKLKYPAKVMVDCVGSKGTIACDIPKQMHCSYNPNLNLVMIKHAEQLSCSVKIVLWSTICNNGKNKRIVSKWSNFSLKAFHHQSMGLQWHWWKSCVVCARNRKYDLLEPVRQYACEDIWSRYIPDGSTGRISKSVMFGQ